MAVVTGITGAITSWATGSNAFLAGTGTNPNKATINMEAEEFDATAFDTTGMAAYIKGLRSWSVDFEAYIKVVAHGANGASTHTNGYNANIRAWTMDVVRDSFDSTAFNDTNEVKTFEPGLIRWGGTYSGFMDGTTALIAAGLPSSDAAGLFKYQEATTDQTLGGTIFTTRASGSSSPAALNAVTYNYRGTGALTQSATGSGIFADGAVANTVAGSLVFTASTGRTFTGDAFWERVSISVGVGSLVTVSVTARGTGALTIG